MKRWKVRAACLLAVIVGIVALGVWLRQAPESSTEPAAPRQDPEPPSAFEPISENVKLLRGRPFEEEYGQPTGDQTSDLVALHDCIVEFQTFEKQLEQYFLSGNEDWVRVLQGNNRTGLAWLPRAHPMIDADGRLLDRAGQPIVFHRLRYDRCELRSSGADGQLYTADDPIWPKSDDSPLSP